MNQPASDNPFEHLQLHELDKSYSWMQEMLKQLLAWYTFFLTANIGLIGYLTKSDAPSVLGPLPPLMLFLDSCGVALIAVSWRYFGNADSRNRQLIATLNQMAGIPPEAAIHSVFPRQSLGVGFLFLALGLVALVVVWGSLALH